MGTTGPEYIKDFLMQKVVVKAIINEEDISEKATLVSVILYSEYSQVAIPLEYIKDKKGLINNIDYYLLSNRGSVYNIAEGIRLAHEQVVSSSRPHAIKTVFLFLTDSIPEDLVSKLDILQKKGVKVIVIAIGNTLKEELEKIHTSGIDIFIVTDANKVPEIVAKIKETQKPGIVLFSLHYLYIL